MATVPAVAASLKIQSRQRKQEHNSNRQAELTSSLADLQRQEKLAQEQLQLAQSSHQQIDLQIQGLRSKQAELAQIEAKRQFAIDSATQSELKLQSINNKIHQYSATKKQLELQMLTLQSKWNSLQSDIAQKKVDLDRSIQSKQDLLQKLNLDLGRQITLLSEAEAKKALAINSAQQSDLKLEEIREEINQQSARKEQLASRVENLQNQLRSLRSEISEREIHRIEIEEQIYRSENRQNQLLAAVGDLYRSIQDKQAFDYFLQRLHKVKVTSIKHTILFQDCILIRS